MPNVTEILADSIGLAIAILLGPVVGWLVSTSTKSIELLPPAGINRQEWLAAIRMPSEIPGKWLGFLERALSFIAFATNGLEIIAGWLAFKVASKWEIWHNIVHVPKTLEDATPLSYLRARRAWGSWMMMRFLIGTIGNILAGFAGFFVGKHGIEILKAWLC